MGWRREFTDEKVEAFVRRYHGYVREDPDLGQLYGSCVKDWDAHSHRLAAYWGPALRHEPTPDFPQLTAVRFGMTAEMLERWLEIWNKAAEESFSGKLLEDVRLQGQFIAEEHMIGKVSED